MISGKGKWWEAPTWRQVEDDGTTCWKVTCPSTPTGIWFVVFTAREKQFEYEKTPPHWEVLW